MTGKLSKNFHGVGIGPLSNILAIKTPRQFPKKLLILDKKAAINRLLRDSISVSQKYWLQYVLIHFYTVYWAEVSSSKVYVVYRHILYTSLQSYWSPGGSCALLSNFANQIILFKPRKQIIPITLLQLLAPSPLDFETFLRSCSTY